MTAAREWAAIAPRIGARGRVRIARNGHEYRDGERALTISLPPYAAAVYIYEYGKTRLLAGDFDVKAAVAAGATDPAALVAAEAADFAGLIQICGGHGFADVAPTGGRHAYVPFTETIHLGEMRWIVLALARRYVTFDPKPMLSNEGLITVPGALTKRGGHRHLTTPLAHVEHVLDHPNGSGVWDDLWAALAPEIEAAEADLPARATAASPSALPYAPAPGDRGPADTTRARGTPHLVRVDDNDDSWLPRADGPLPALSPRLEDIARTGRYPQGVTGAGVYRSDSEARQAVVSGAVACGWRKEHYTARLNSGAWPGQAAFYARYRTERQRLDAIDRDWQKAVTWLSEREFDRDIHTRGPAHRGGYQVVLAGGVEWDIRRITPDTEKLGEYRKLRAWDSALAAAIRAGRWRGKKAITYWRVLSAMLKAGQLSANTVIGFGVRSLALAACLDESTVAKALRDLRDEPDAFVDHVAAHHGEWPDYYRLIVPQAYAETAAWRTWRPGKLGGLHPVFRELGGPAALVYDRLDAAVPLRTIDIQTETGLSATGTTTALRTLGEYGLAVKRDGGWVRGPSDPDRVAEQLDIPERLAQLVEKYRQQRVEWRKWLQIAEANHWGLNNAGGDLGDHPIPLQQVADAGPPPWMEDEPHGPPNCVPTAWF
ncbi:hypothetical protein [Sinosporangium album]|uniref:hypothetical protein n=1 Tax=Sinosporangium album TaxID=504805 RepID=UPI000B815F04|nr:hypothetical protein [Sinosporangium album]